MASTGAHMKRKRVEEHDDVVVECGSPMKARKGVNFDSPSGGVLTNLDSKKDATPLLQSPLHHAAKFCSAKRSILSPSALVSSPLRTSVVGKSSCVTGMEGGSSKGSSKVSSGSVNEAFNSESVAKMSAGRSTSNSSMFCSCSPSPLGVTQPLTSSVDSSTPHLTLLHSLGPPSTAPLTPATVSSAPSTADTATTPAQPSCMRTPSLTAGTPLASASGPRSGSGRPVTPLSKMKKAASSLRRRIQRKLFSESAVVTSPAPNSTVDPETIKKTALASVPLGVVQRLREELLQSNTPDDCASVIESAQEHLVHMRVSLPDHSSISMEQAQKDVVRDRVSVNGGDEIVNDYPAVRKLITSAVASSVPDSALQERVANSVLKLSCRTSSGSDSLFAIKALCGEEAMVTPAKGDNVAGAVMISITGGRIHMRCDNVFDVFRSTQTTCDGAPKLWFRVRVVTDDHGSLNYPERSRTASMYALR